ncbi:MAG TPA: translocation/assembly module TamB domain-containing protein [Bordetella sp.]
MALLRAVLHWLLVWLLPGLAMLAALCLACALWLLGSQAGAQLLLPGALELLGGHAEAVQGSVLRGLRVGRLQAAFGGTEVDVEGLALEVDWRALLARRAHVRLLAADRLRIVLAGAAAGAGPDDAPMAPITLPVAVALDRLELGSFELVRDGQPLPVSLDGLSASLAADADGARLRVDGLRAGHAQEQAQVQGSVELGPQPWSAQSLRALALDLSREGGQDLSLRVGRQALDARTDRLAGTLRASRFDLGSLLGPGLPQALLDLQADFEADVAGLQTLRRLHASARIGGDSRWNGQALSGTLEAGIRALDAPADPQAPLPGWALDAAQADLRLGASRISLRGQADTHQGQLALEANIPALAAFWPGLPGGARLQARVEGTAASHRLTAQASYASGHAQAGRLGMAPLRLDVAAQGGWGPGPDGAPTGWRGTVSRLSADSAGFSVALGRPAPLAWLPGAQAPQWGIQVGATTLSLAFPGGQRLVLSHAGSRLGGGRWETAGRGDGLALTTDMMNQLHRALGAPVRAGGDAAGRGAAPSQRVVLDASWNLRFDGALAGQARIERRAGDLLIPGSPPISLGLRGLTLSVAATPTGPATSRLDASLDLRTEKMGTLQARASAMLAALALDARQPVRTSLDADIGDLAWLGLFTGDAYAFGGALRVQAQAQGTPQGKWSAQGSLHGTGLRMLRLEDGVQLVDGTLDAHLDGDRFVLDALRFPASRQVMPQDARTRDWVEHDPDAQGGDVEASGHWDLAESRGQVDVRLHRFPALQRADRYAMLSGALRLDAELPRLRLTGDLTADAGWASVDILQGVPTLDDDVHVARPGQESAAPATPLQFDMDIGVNAGPRFFLTGMGLDAGLQGSLRIVMQDGQLRGTGELRTRAGTFQAYGQKLQLRRGIVTFQGRLDNPLLDIEAVRTDIQQVQAGVRVAGTAQRPRIDLISTPDMSDVEKLSWLVMGRAPDASGSDTALLLSVGASLLGGDTPFYKQLGLDDVGIRTGTLGSSGSLLPDQTVATNAVDSTSASDLATQFIVASKHFANGITLSVEQAMSGTGTVGRASYRLARGLSLDLKAGEVNGLDLVYRWFLGE